jgi:hypothetical protein
MVADVYEWVLPRHRLALFVAILQNNGAIAESSTVETEIDTSSFYPDLGNKKRKM